MQTRKRDLKRVITPIHNRRKPRTATPVMVHAEVSSAEADITVDVVVSPRKQARLTRHEAADVGVAAIATSTVAIATALAAASTPSFSPQKAKRTFDKMNTTSAEDVVSPFASDDVVPLLDLQSEFPYSRRYATRDLERMRRAGFTPQQAREQLEAQAIYAATPKQPTP